ncbi:hypothetical protein AB7C87_17460 [Natrarchaeobius sp. A-rgal3]|uniref:hypothetical protein n=1 Tax=Natrarchaeobius versutus TaxID=1679078 RepID=UPI003510849E
MSENPDSLSNGVRWGSRLGAVGLTIAAVAVIVSSAGLELAGQLYWVGIVLSIGGVAWAAVRGAQHSSGWYGGGVISALVGVIVVGYGIENEVMLATIVGVLAVAGGVGAVVVATRRLA